MKTKSTLAAHSSQEKEDVKSDHKKIMTAIDNRFSQIQKGIELSTKKNIQVANEVSKTVASHQKFLQNILESMNAVDETLCNVLLAIRQNEYLQAYYPAQNGYPEMKVTGVHPASFKKSKER